MNKLEETPKPEDLELNEVMREEADRALKKIPDEIMARGTSRLLTVTIEKLIESGLLTEKSNIDDLLRILRMTLDKTNLAENTNFIEFAEKILEEKQD